MRGNKSNLRSILKRESETVPKLFQEVVSVVPRQCDTHEMSGQVSEVG